MDTKVQTAAFYKKSDQCTPDVFLEKLEKVIENFLVDSSRLPFNGNLFYPIITIQINTLTRNKLAWFRIVFLCLFLLPQINLEFIMSFDLDFFKNLKVGFYELKDKNNKIKTIFISETFISCAKKLDREINIYFRKYKYLGSTNMNLSKLGSLHHFTYTFNEILDQILTIENPEKNLEKKLTIRMYTTKSFKAFWIKELLENFNSVITAQFLNLRVYYLKEKYNFFFKDDDSYLMFDEDVKNEEDLNLIYNTILQKYLSNFLVSEN
jgi:hypothetical protein